MDKEIDIEKILYGIGIDAQTLLDKKPVLKGNNKIVLDNIINILTTIKMDAENE